MGFIGDMFSSKKALSTPKLPDAPAVPDPKVLEAEQRAKMRDRARANSGQSTMLTGTTGLQTQAPTQSKSLLGG
jgi:hypothetical protein